MSQAYDFIGIGDTVTDAFIRLKEASVHCNIDREKCEICMRFQDKIPYEDVFVVPAVGNSANASVAAARLGLRSALVTNLGGDNFGKECLEALEKEGVARDFIRQHQGRKTNYHFVLWFDDDRTILVKHEEYDYALPDIGNPKWIYLSSLGGNSFPFHDAIVEYLSRQPEIKLAFQPGTYQMKFGREKLKAIYQRTDIFFSNKEEAQRILETDEHDIKKLLAMMHELGPKMAVITDGKAGAFVFDGADFWMMPIYPDPKPPLERTGAGDAFSSTVTVALALGKPLEEALAWGPINSMAVVQEVGARAGLLTREKLEEYLKNAPENYKPVQI